MISGAAFAHGEWSIPRKRRHPLVVLRAGVRVCDRHPGRLSGSSHTARSRWACDHHRDGDSQPLQREQFEALAEHTRDSAGEGYDLERLPPKAEPYAAVLALYPRYVLDQEEGRIIELEEANESAVLDETPHLSTTTDGDERAEPDVSVYADALLLIDALEREDPTDIDAIDMPALVNLYTLLSDVQRNANDLRKDVTDVLLGRVQHDGRRPECGVLRDRSQVRY